MEQSPQRKRQDPAADPSTDCFLDVYTCGTDIFSVNINQQVTDSTFAGATPFNSTMFTPCGMNYTLQFVVTCPANASFLPTLSLGNVTLFQAASTPTGSNPPASSTGAGSGSGAVGVGEAGFSSGGSGPINTAVTGSNSGLYFPPFPIDLVC